MLSFLPVLYLLADRMRNAGKFTVANVLAYRLRRRPVRVAAAINALLISGIYLTAQLVGAGSLIEALAGISFAPAVLICGVFMVIYVVFGGMLATTWVQIIKTGMLMTAGVVVSVAVLAKFNFSPSELLDKAAAEHDDGRKILGPGTYLDTPALVISTGLTIFIGTAGLPHILMRFFTVPDAKAARVSVLWTIGIIGVFTALVTVMGFGSRAVLGAGAEEAVGKGGNLAAPLLAQSLGGGEGTTGGAAAIVGTLLIGTGFNVTVLVSMAFVFAASANFPPLILALTWRRFNTTGALIGVAFGIVASIVMIALSPPVWPGPDSEGAPSSLTFPGLVTIPIGLLGCWLGTVLGRAERQPQSFDELLVRSETGLGAEGGPQVRPRRRAREEAPVREPVRG